MKTSSLFRWSGALMLLLVLCANAVAGPISRKAITIQFVNEAADVPGVWDPSIRSDFVEAMNTAANDVSANWRGNAPVVISSDLKSPRRLIVVDHPISFGGASAGGFHYYDATGPYAIFDLSQAIQQEGAAGPFLFGSHEIAEMLADPYSNRTMNRWLVEIADPVVCCHYDLTLSDGNVVPVSDFVLPAWFKRKNRGPYDFINSLFIQEPFQFGPDGY
jgi:hypothetical protein